MHPGTTASLICPACGQAFLSMQQGMEGMVQCPHCAHSALRMQFGTQAQVASVAQVRRRIAQTRPTQDVQPPPPAYQPQPVWTSVPPPPPALVRANLQPSQALMPVGAPPPPGDSALPSHADAAPRWPLVVMPLFVVVCVTLLWFWWERADVPAVDVKPAAVPPSAALEVRKAEVVAKSDRISAGFERPDEFAIAAEAKALVTALFEADTAELRAACIHEASRHTEEIESVFAAGVVPRLELRFLARIPGLPLRLPGGSPAVLFKLVTSRCPQGALVRLETGTDGRRRIEWPLFYETHEAKLPRLIEGTGSFTASWVHLGLRPSHGLDIPADLRSKYLTFDLQVSASSVPHYVACVERDTPLGRFLDRQTEWGRTYLTRFLVRRLEIESDAPCVLVLDCEGAKEGGEGRGR